MGGSLIERLILHAGLCESFSAFYDAVAGESGIIGAEQAALAEFGNLKALYEWARSRPGASHKTSAIFTTLVLHPRVIELRSLCDALSLSLEEALCELQELLVIIVPNLKALYMLKVGSAEIELLTLTVETRKMRRTIELIQAYLNRGEAPDLQEIEKKLDLELAEWRETLARQAEALAQARRRMEHTMTVEETAAFKSLYRKLVRRLHPDINPGQGERERGLWLRLQGAYERGDMEEMKLIEVLLDYCAAVLAPRMGIDAWEERKARLEKKLRLVNEEIAAEKSRFPCSMRARIESDRWAEEHNRETRRKIEEKIALKKMWAAKLENMRGALRHE